MNCKHPYIQTLKENKRPADYIAALCEGDSILERRLFERATLSEVAAKLKAAEGQVWQIRRVGPFGHRLVAEKGSDGRTAIDL